MTRTTTVLNASVTEHVVELVDGTHDTIVVHRIRGAKDTPYAIKRRGMVVARVAGTHLAESFIDLVLVPAINQGLEVVAKLKASTTP